jgi:hypothetical protein
MEQGVLQLTLAWDGKQIVAGRIALSRPAAARVLRVLPGVPFLPRSGSLPVQALLLRARGCALVSASGARLAGRLDEDPLPVSPDPCVPYAVRITDA